MSVTAIAPDGSPYYRGKLPDAVPPAGAANIGGSISFEVAPGKVELKLAVESAASEVLDSEVREISVPDLTSIDVGIATTPTRGTPDHVQRRHPGHRLPQPGPSAMPVHLALTWISPDQQSRARQLIAERVATHHLRQTTT